MTVRVRFQNGAEAPEVMLDETFEDKDVAKARIPDLVDQYGTVPDAAAWVDGDDPPKHLGGADATPAAEKAAKEKGVDVADVKPTGASGQVTKADVDKAAAK